MKTIYATTLPGWFDTKAIAKGKLLQQLNNPSSILAGLVAVPDNVDVGWNDGEVRTLQKILMTEQ